MTNFIQEVRAIEIVEDSFERFKSCLDLIQQAVVGKPITDINVFDLQTEMVMLNQEWDRLIFNTRELNYAIGRLSTKEIG